MPQLCRPYADVRCSLDKTGSDFNRLSNDTEALQNCFWNNEHHLDPDKSDAACFSRQLCVKKLGLPSSNSVGGCPVAVPLPLNILGVSRIRRSPLLTTSSRWSEHVTTIAGCCAASPFCDSRHRQYTDLKHRWHSSTIVMRYSREKSIKQSIDFSVYKMDLHESPVMYRRTN